MDDRATPARRRYDDAELDQLTRAAVDAFPLLPTARAAGAVSPARDAASPAHPRRRPPAHDAAQTATSAVDVRPWQMSHVRQYDVIDGYPVHRP